MRDAWSGNEDERNVMGPPVTRAVSVSGVRPIKEDEDTKGTGYLVAIGSRTTRLRRKHQRKIVIGLLVLLIIIVVIIAIVMTVLYVRQKKVKSIKHKICNSKDCIKSAANLIMSMDSQTDPCEDFYQYACGNWESEHSIPDGYSSFDWFRETQDKVYKDIHQYLLANKTGRPWAVEQASNLLKACIDDVKLNELGLKPVLDALSMLELPKHPTMLFYSNETDLPFDFDWLNAVTNIKIYLGMDVLIGFDIFTDPKNSKAYKMVLGAPETTNPFPSLYNYYKTSQYQKTIIDRFKYKRKKGKRSKFRTVFQSSKKLMDIEEEDMEFYKQYYATILKELFRVKNDIAGTIHDDFELEQQTLNAAEEYILIACDIYELMEASENFTDIYDNLDLFIDLIVPDYTVYELNNITDGSGDSDENVWQKYLDGVFKASSINLDYEEDTILIFDEDLNYLKMLVNFVESTSYLKLELFVWFQVVEVMIVHTTTEMRLLNQKYLNEASDDESYSSPVLSRKLHCLAAVSDRMGMAASYAIIDKNLFINPNPKVEKMLAKLKKSLEKQIRKTSWMDIDTKIASIDKIHDMRSLIGYPKWLLNVTSLNSYYEGISIASDRHLDNLISLVQYDLRKKLNKLHDVADVEWATNPSEVNAYHTFQENSITIPLVMLQFPFFNLGLEALEYGALGTILGHEITHGFDNIGRYFDSSGNMVPWWSNKTIKSFEDMMDCYIKQYSAFYIEEVDDFVNGDITLGENIADAGGVRLAFDSFFKDKNSPKLPGFEQFTQEQMFFLAYGNLWCSSTTKKSLALELQDEHPPTKYRLKGALQNSEEFTRAWKCKINSTMNPAKPKCYLF